MAVVCASLCLTACGPIYKTDYTYIPPEDSASRQCLNQCLGMQADCRARAEDRATRENTACQQNAMVNYSVCLATAKTEADRNRCSASSYCNRQPDLSPCDADYRACYRNCGGTIISQQRCISGC
ncbi:hypothetical protein CKO36_12960 [Rhabdochromatium marinum]|nr:hypothetical protein [Rhabdochromatium marinum]